MDCDLEVVRYDSEEKLYLLRCKRGDCSKEKISPNPPEKTHFICESFEELSNEQAFKRFSRASLKLLKSKKKFVDKEVYDYRTGVCDPCQSKKKNRCVLCKCRIKGQIVSKAKWVTESCPVDKWFEKCMDAPLCTVQGKPLSSLENLYRGATGFYIGAGPSLNKLNLDLLHQRGIWKIAVNNVAANVVYPNVWVSVDNTKKFCDNIWKDPTIMKFCPYHGSQTSAGKTRKPTKDFPNVNYFSYNSQFNHKTFFSENTISWGCKKGVKGSDGTMGGRSVMLVALRIAYYLGIRRLYLLGCDFNMLEKQPYAFSQYKKPAACLTNNDGYRILKNRLDCLKPLFKKNSFEVFNSTPKSKLDIFDYVPYEDAIADSLSNFPTKVDTTDMYGRG